MKVLLSLAFVALVSANTVVEPNLDTIISHVNSKATTWKAGHNSFTALPVEQRLRMMTGLLPTPENMKLATKPKVVPEGWTAPESFDAREQWSDCPTIPKIQDQGNCGSCWAVAAATVMSDRACIQSSGAANFQYSMENLLACSNNVLVGSCNGGYINAAFNYWNTHGIVSGGPYQSEEGCQTYSIAPTGSNDDTPPCLNTCRAGYGVAYNDDIRYGESSYGLVQDENEIMNDIMTKGPVEAGFTVYSDFQTYTSGVYQHEHGILPLGGHAIRILGWGVENGTPYWLCANSWNVNWGESGFFKILRGTNECGIEAQVHSGDPRPL